MWKNNDWAYERHFSMDAVTLERINNKLSDANDAGIEGDQNKRFRALKIIFNNTVFKFHDDKNNPKDSDVIEVENLIIEINNEFKNQPVVGDRQSFVQYNNLKVGEIELKLDDLEKKINALLFKYNIIHLKVLKREYERSESWK